MLHISKVEYIQYIFGYMLIVNVRTNQYNYINAHDFVITKKGAFYISFANNAKISFSFFRITF